MKEVGEEVTDRRYLHSLDYYLGGGRTAPRFLAWVPDGLWFPFIKHKHCRRKGRAGVEDMINLLLDLIRFQVRYSGADILWVVDYRVLSSRERSR